MKTNRLFVLIVCIIFSMPAVGYNASDLRYHVDYLVNSIIAGDDFRESSVIIHLNISCDEEDVKNEVNQNINKICANFYDNLNKLIEKKEIINKFTELCKILEKIYIESRENNNPEQQAACIMVGREVSRSLFGLCCMHCKDKKSVSEIQAVREQFLNGLVVNKPEPRPATQDTVRLADITDASTIDSVYESLNAASKTEKLSRTAIVSVLIAAGDVLKTRLIQKHDPVRRSQSEEIFK